MLVRMRDEAPDSTRHRGRNSPTACARPATATSGRRCRHSAATGNHRAIRRPRRSTRRGSPRAPTWRSNRCCTRIASATPSSSNGSSRSSRNSACRRPNGRTPRWSGRSTCSRTWTASSARCPRSTWPNVQRVLRSSIQRRVQLVRDVLGGASIDSAELGYRLEQEHVAVIATGPTADASLRDVAAGSGAGCSRSR